MARFCEGESSAGFGGGEVVTDPELEATGADGPDSLARRVLDVAFEDFVVTVVVSRLGLGRLEAEAEGSESGPRVRFEEVEEPASCSTEGAEREVAVIPGRSCTAEVIALVPDDDPCADERCDMLKLSEWVRAEGRWEYPRVR